MKGKISKKVIIGTICFIFIGMILLHIATQILIPKWIVPKDSRMTYVVKGFYEEPKDSLDVLFMGNSDVYRGISPIKMWDEYGFTSYVFSTAGSRMWTAYYLLEESLKYQNPKLIVLNMDFTFNESDASEANYRKAFDNMKLGTTKIKAIQDPIFNISNEQKLSYIFPIARYHSRWDELTAEDFTEVLKKERFAYKGLDMVSDIKPYTGGNKYMERRDFENEKIGERCNQYLEKIINLCKEKNIQLLLMEIPSADSWTKDLSDKIKDFAQGHDLDFVDMNLNFMEFGFDWETATCDGGDHLNVYGAESVSTYLGNYIQEKYNIPNKKGDSKYSYWNEDSIRYNNDKNNLKKNIK